MAPGTDVGQVHRIPCCASQADPDECMTENYGDLCRHFYLCASTPGEKIVGETSFGSESHCSRVVPVISVEFGTSAA